MAVRLLRIPFDAMRRAAPSIRPVVPAPGRAARNDRSLVVRLEIAGRRPPDLASLGQVSGIGQAKLERYGAELIGLMGASD